MRPAFLHTPTRAFVGQKARKGLLGRKSYGAVIAHQPEPLKPSMSTHRAQTRTLLAMPGRLSRWVELRVSRFRRYVTCDWCLVSRDIGDSRACRKLGSVVSKVISKQMSVTEAAAACGVSRQHIHRWLAR